MIRLLHTADWQIGRRYSQFDPDDAAILAEERTNAVARIAQLAADRSVDCVLVPGDVFDAQTVSDRVIRKLFGAMGGFLGTWCLIPGNHDAALAESVWSRAERLGVIPANVRVALKPGVIELPELRAAVLAAPLTQRHTYNDTTEFFDHAVTPDGWLRIGLAHGSIEGILDAEIDSANPIASNRVQSARLDYLALGDWHGMKIVSERCAYSGTPEQDRFKSNDPGFCLLVDLELAATPRIEPVRTGLYCWRSDSYTLAVPSDVDRVCRALDSYQSSDVVSLVVQGHVDLAGLKRLKDGIGKAHAAARSLALDMSELRLLPTADDIASLQADGYLSDVIDELREEQLAGAAPAKARIATEALALLCAELGNAAEVL